jgi:hypothetical protein
MMKRLTAQLFPTLLAALFSLLTLATLPDDTEAAALATPGPGVRWLGFAVRFVVARLFWGS